MPQPGLKPKGLVGIPVARSVRLAGRRLVAVPRQRLAQANPMPESTKDRCTSSHEYLFHLTNALGSPDCHNKWSVPSSRE
jgi:hypothetical protein